MKLGIIGDDFTGSSDIANNLKKSGMQVSMYAGVPNLLPEEIKKEQTDAAVIALKTRTIPIEDAIRESLEALSWLKDCGCEQFIFKYCSTFDSTKEGNIGPVTDAIMEELNTDFTIACPSFPDAGRTVYFGHMFVNGKPLNESGMENHPLTPMTDHNLVRWLGYQTKNNVGLIDFETISKGKNSVKEKIRNLKTDGYKYAIIDTNKNDDFDIICNAVKNLPFLTGGSGIALGLPKIYKERGLLSVSNFQIPKNNSNAIILSGSCSVTTINQINIYKENNPSFYISPDEVINNEDLIEKVLSWIKDHETQSPLLYSSSDIKAVSEKQKQYGQELLANKIEKFFELLSKRLVKDNFGTFISAGGETSGAVIKGLGIQELKIGKEISHGVPALWSPESNGNKPVSVTLKSGNFGQDDFFTRALKALKNS
ncbi:four-carbon acid sugar kinase family protein [Alphaproteobacteria bacterium]|nr:four-carbon acid sugar kinase family protein [Alphaproteobacteria bacterium]